MSRRTSRPHQGSHQASTKWSPMQHTTLAPWERYSAELIQRGASSDAPVSDEACKLAAQVRDHVDVSEERAGLLAQHCVDRGEQKMLVAVAERVADRSSFRSWARLLSEVILARKGRAGGAKRGKKQR